MKYVIEHLEKELYEWSIIEYCRISEIVGKDNLMIFNLKEQEVQKLKDIAQCFTESVNSSKDIDVPDACVLDPQAPNTLSKDERFAYLVFGGILGDDPPTGKTSEILLDAAERRNIGDAQMTTDNAVLCTKMIMGGKDLQEIEFIDDLEITLDDGESIVMPFRYIVRENGKPFIADEIVELIKKEGF